LTDTRAEDPIPPGFVDIGRDRGQIVVPQHFEGKAPYNLLQTLPEELGGGKQFKAENPALGQEEHPDLVGHRAYGINKGFDLVRGLKPPRPEIRSGRCGTDI
jgi:hypothetical protein